MIDIFTLVLILFYLIVTFFNCGFLITHVSIFFLQFLKDTNNIVKCKCLNLIGAVLPICENNRETLELVANFSYSEDARVRSAALSTLVVLFERKQKLDVGFYKKACDALKDDYEIVRLSALNLIGVLSQTYGEE